MKLAVLVNDLVTLVPSQTTAMLIHSAAERGHQVTVVTAGSMSMSEDDVIQAMSYPVVGQETLADTVAAVRQTKPSRASLQEADLLLIRTNPARDQARSWAHQVALMMARMLKERGILVLNDPDGLTRAANKLYLSYLPPSTRPRTFVSSHPKELRAYIDALEAPFVMKPLQGTRGRDVFFLRPGVTSNWSQLIEVLTRNGTAMVQEFLEEAVDGDVRVVLMDGEVLQNEGGVCAIHRVPGIGELRSNIHAGGTPKHGVITDAMYETIDLVRPILQRDGIFLAGLDFIGSKLVELNVFSTGGLRDAELFTGGPLASRVIEALEGKLQQHKAAQGQQG